MEQTIKGFVVVILFSAFLLFATSNNKKSDTSVDSMPYGMEKVD